MYCWSLAWRILSITLLVWDECNCAVVWAFTGIALLWDWNENWPFPVLWPLLSTPPQYTLPGQNATSFTQGGIMSCAHSLSYVQLCDPLDCSLPGISQARILEWIAISSSRGSFWPRDWTCVSWIAGGFLTYWAIEGVMKLGFKH